MRSKFLFVWRFVDVALTVGGPYTVQAQLGQALDLCVRGESAIALKKT